MDIYIHAAYVINVASTNNRIRIPSRKLLQQTVDLAAEVNAKGVIVHGGHVTKDDDPNAGFDYWRKACEQTEMHVPVLIENIFTKENYKIKSTDENTFILLRDKIEVKKSRNLQKLQRIVLIGK